MLFDSDWKPGRLREVRSLFALVAIVWAIIDAEWRQGQRDNHVVVALLAVLASAGWLLALVATRRHAVVLAGLRLCCGAGAVLVAVGPLAALGFPAAGCVLAATKLRPVRSAALTVATAVVYAVGEIAVHAPEQRVGGGVLALAMAFMVGLIRYQGNANAEQVELRLAEAQHAKEEQARAATLAERARIAREIHDILAHALAALSVQLETVDALIERGRAEQARQTLGRARQLTREGLAETRRAVSALRGDPLPMPQLLQLLASGYTADTGAGASVELTGEQRPLNPDVGLVFYRTAQEAMTNVRKHAPGATVTMILGYGAAEVSLAVINRGGGASVVDVPSGYGLTGLRERAELASGHFDAGPVDGGWRVAVEVPA